MKTYRFMIAVCAVAVGFAIAACSGKDKNSTEEMTVLDISEEMPEFPGGDSALVKWLGENVKYPAEAENQGIEGRVLVRFVVNEQGDVVSPEVINDSVEVDTLLCNEALRVVKAMPKWTPGKNGGKPVNVYFTLPVTFQLGEIYDLVEQMPLFPGGDEALMSWLSENINYPEDALKKGVEGRVIIRFVIDANGNVTNAEVVKSVDKALDDEALRVVRAMPKWTPGKKDGNPVRVWFTLPVAFKK